MIKLLEIIIKDTCEHCPYCEYDSDFDGKNKSGYDCNNPHTKYSRIIDDISYYKMADISRTPIPDWCPLATLAD